MRFLALVFSMRTHAINANKSDTAVQIESDRGTRDAQKARQPRTKSFYAWEMKMSRKRVLDFEENICLYVPDRSFYVSYVTVVCIRI